MIGENLKLLYSWAKSISMHAIIGLSTIENMTYKTIKELDIEMMYLI